MEGMQGPIGQPEIAGVCIPGVDVKDGEKGDHGAEGPTGIKGSHGIQGPPRPPGLGTGGNI